MCRAAQADAWAFLRAARTRPPMPSISSRPRLTVVEASGTGAPGPVMSVTRPALFATLPVVAVFIRPPGASVERNFTVSVAPALSVPPVRLKLTKSPAPAGVTKFRGPVGVPEMITFGSVKLNVITFVLKVGVTA